PWLYDFGYIGVVILTGVMAIISQLIFNIARIKRKVSLSLSQIIYSYIGSFIALSFFSNKFFESINTNFIYTVLICYLLKVLYVNKYKFLTEKY
ncbi:oligosaccharide repeat unit polymerase, partial [Lactobacillus crispatus]|uniref:oligosaccharide repeat unit polymerase n=1 Tax=Lactobacillus crispatus TaxID=47770 RepID=UPI0018E2DDE9